MSDTSSHDPNSPIGPESIPTLTQSRFPKLIILSRMRLMEAELAKTKLESEGITCLIRDANTFINNPFVVDNVPLMVDSADEARAREILARPAAADAEGEYVDEPWRCPQCHRKSVKLLPLTGFWRNIRLLWIVAMIAPALMEIAKFTGLIAGYRLPGWTPMLWLVAMVCVGVMIFTRPRTKRCDDCGHEWEHR